MQGSALIELLKILGYLMVVLMAAAIVYSSYITVSYWSGIGV